MFQICHIMRGCLNIFKKMKCFQITSQTNCRLSSLNIALITELGLHWTPGQSIRHWILISQLTLFWKVKLHLTAWIDNFLHSMTTNHYQCNGFLWKLEVLLILSYNSEILHVFFKICYLQVFLRRFWLLPWNVFQ